MKLQPPAVILCGPPGSGKTSAIATLLRCGIEVFVLVTEPGGVESLLDACTRLKLPITNLHWHSVLPKATGMQAMMQMTDKIGRTIDYDAMAKIKDSFGKEKFRETAMEVLRTIADFHCDRTGQNYGDVTTWGDDRAFVIDSLTGISIISWKLTVGYKPTGAPADYGISQNWIFNLLNDIHCDRQCFFILTTHIEKEPDELTGVKKLHVSTIGQKLAPKVPNFFSEVVLTSRTQAKGFLWSTIDNQMDLKNRALPIGADLTPDFRPVVEAYRNRVKMASATPSPAPATTQPKPPGPVVVSAQPMGKATS